VGRTSRRMDRSIKGDLEAISRTDYTKPWFADIYLDKI
jgi:hypothetical protein